MKLVPICYVFKSIPPVNEEGWKWRGNTGDKTFRVVNRRKKVINDDNYVIVKDYQLPYVFHKIKWENVTQYNLEIMWCLWQHIIR